MPRANLLKAPIAIVGDREAYRHLCSHCKLDPSNNDVFFHVFDVVSACGRDAYSRLLELDGAQDIRNYNAVVSMVRARIRN